MQQIRLSGENEELVQSIVNLSTRYGIITPYTSFLIEEDDIFAQTDGAPVEAFEALAAPAQASGAEAVDRAAVEGELALAAAPAPLATVVAYDADGQAVVQAAVQTAGSRTFFLRDGVWVDSAYDESADPQPQAIPFASDAYFDLLNDRPELGEALALGGEMIIVVDGAAYRITDTGDESNTTISQPVDPVAETDDTPPVDETSGVTAFGIEVCASALILPLAAIVWGASKRRPQRQP
jgi:Ca-activated chloride channel family protein